MTQRNYRKPATFGFVAVAVFLALASTAYACTVFKGQMSVAVTSGGSGTSSVQSNGGFMNWCSFTPGASGSKTGPTAITVSVTPGTTGNGCTSVVPLPDTPLMPAPNKPNYDVNFTNFVKIQGKTVSGFTITGGVYNWKADCMTGDTRNGVQFVLGNGADATGLTVTNGSGSHSYTLPTGLIANGPSDASAVCVTSNSDFNVGNTTVGNQAPIAIV